MIGKKVYGQGPMPCNILLCGEGPGRTESELGLPFQGASGTDLTWVFLKRAARIQREDIYITNMVKWRTDEEDRDPTSEEIARDEEELKTEIELCNPEIVVAVGRVAGAWFHQSNNIDMEKLHGVPTRCPRYPEKTLLVVYHPAAGLHQADRYYDKVFWDFEQLGRLLRGEIACHLPQRAVHYSEGVPPGFGGPIVAVDTEGSAAAPWGLSVAAEEGRAFVLRGAEETPTRSMLRDVLQGRAVAHNILHDLDVLSSLGTPVSPDRCDDTMLEAYLLPWLPRRLKALSYKLCGVEQEEYEDIIKEPEERITREYLQKILSTRVCTDCRGSGKQQVPYKRQPSKYRTVDCGSCHGDGTSWPSPEPELVFDSDQSARVTRPKSTGRRVRELLKRGADLRGSWNSTDRKVRACIEAELGNLREATLDDVPLDRAIHYSAADADCTLRVHHVLEPILKKEGLWDVYQIDKGIIPIIHRMHSNGIRIDVDHFRSLHQSFSKEQSRLATLLANVAGGSFNPASPLQTAALFYDTLGCKPIRGKRSTDEKTLETLKIKYKSVSAVCESVDLITEHRELSKLDGTYVGPLLDAADSGSRIHTQFLLHVAATGRLVSRNPNLQNIPTRTERGRLIRAGFIPRDGCRLVSVDLDQIELRVAAHLSGDEGLIDVFTNNKDIHRNTAALIYGKRIEDVTTLERLLAKTINFLILYRGGPGRLHSELALLGITTTKDQCVQYINDWFRAYPGVREYIDRCDNQARSTGYVQCFFGRRRYVQGVYSCVDRVREESLKWATNFPVQATAAALLKIWMRRVWDNVIPAMASQGYCEPILTIHDELIFEAQEELCDELIRQVVREAGLAAQLLVPIKAKGVSAVNWSLLKE